MSSSKRTKHIKAKYFFVTDKVAQGDVVIEHKSTNDMWIDSHTKPKQGTPFRLDRSYVMNCPLVIPDETLNAPIKAISNSKPMAEQRLQECVGKYPVWDKPEVRLGPAEIAAGSQTGQTAW